MKMTSKSFMFAATVALLFSAPVAVAQSQLPSTNVTSLPSVRVSFADLDVGTGAGMQALSTRIRKAVRTVCWQGNDPRELDDVYACRSHSQRHAWRQFELNQQLARASRGSLLATILIRPTAN